MRLAHMKYALYGERNDIEFPQQTAKTPVGKQ